jgi:hypothetical protein
MEVSIDDARLKKLQELKLAFEGDYRREARLTSGSKHPKGAAAPAQVKTRPVNDWSRYNGARLRVIRASKVNAKGEPRR